MAWATVIACGTQLGQIGFVHYVTVFEASADPYRNLTFVLPGLALSSVGAIMVFRPGWLAKLQFRPSPQKAWFKPFAIFYLLFAVVWTVIAGTAVFSDACNAKRTLLRGDCEIVEGKVEHFDPMPASGHDTERFDVNGVPFSYSDYIVSAGFNNSASHGGPIRCESACNIDPGFGVIGVQN